MGGWLSSAFGQCFWPVLTAIAFAGSPKANGAGIAAGPTLTCRPVPGWLFALPAGLRPSVLRLPCLAPLRRRPVPSGGGSGFRIGCPRAVHRPSPTSWRFRDCFRGGSLEVPSAGRSQRHPLYFRAAKPIIRRRASRCICGSPSPFRGELSRRVFRYCCGLRRRIIWLLSFVPSHWFPFGISRQKRPSDDLKLRFESESHKQAKAKLSTGSALHGG